MGKETHDQMRIGWIDFSKDERDKALGILHLLQEQGAVDELGIGIVRDAFADTFFPGTSTLITRAKYYVVVPYIIQEGVSEGLRRGWTAKVTMDWINGEERKLGERLYRLHTGERESGIIGQMALVHKGWVKRSPSELYWNGIRRFGICGESELSLAQYIEGALAVGRSRGRGLGTEFVGEENEGDDIDAGRVLRLKPFDIRAIYRKSWRGDVDITLRHDEAVYLRDKICGSIDGSVFSCALRNHIDLKKHNGDFESFSQEMSRYVDASNVTRLRLAVAFMKIVYLARVRYNAILQGDRSDKAVQRWNEFDDWSGCPDRDMMIEILRSLELYGRPQYARLQRFLLDLVEMLPEARRSPACWDELIRRRETEIKGASRAKLAHPEKYSADNWVGGDFLEYRLSDAARILDDIYVGLEVGDV